MSIPTEREGRGSRDGHSLWDSGMKKGGGQPGCPAVVLKLWPMSLGGLIRTQITRPHSQISDSVGLGWDQGDADDTSLRTVPLRTSYKGLGQIRLLFPILQFLLIIE